MSGMSLFQWYLVKLLTDVYELNVTFSLDKALNM